MADNVPQLVQFSIKYKAILIELQSPPQQCPEAALSIAKYFAVQFHKWTITPMRDETGRQRRSSLPGDFGAGRGQVLLKCLTG